MSSEKNTNQGPGSKQNTQATSVAELQKKLEEIILDVCDQSEIITLAKANVDSDDVGKTFALVRSIECFNNAIFGKLQPLVDELSKQTLNGGAQ